MSYTKSGLILYDRSRTLVIETGRTNYLEDLEHLIDLKSEIEKFL